MKKYAFEASNVVRSFGGVKALDGISLKSEQGKIFGLLGPNGAGKTTLVRMLSTLLTADSGSLKVLGLDVAKNAAEVRRQIGLAGQFAAVDEFQTGRENITMVGNLYHMPKKTIQKRTNELLERLNLSEAANRPVRTYSGGMRRRLDLGASLIAHPKVLFLDEPTTGLDPRTRMDLWSIIRDLVKEGASILLTTQYMEEADELADSIAVIDHGKVIAEGTSDQLKQRLGGEVIEFAITSLNQYKKALTAVEKLSNKKPSFDEETLTLTLPVKDGSKALTEVVRALDKAKVIPTSLSLHRPSLDDVFLSLTGKKTEAAEALKNMVQRDGVMLITIRNEIADIWIMTKRNLIRYIRLPQLIFFSSVQPVMFLTLFNFVFGGAIGAHNAAPGGKYINFLLPGILAQVVLFGAINTGIGLADDMGKGVIDRFRSLPMSRAAVMGGRTVADMIRNLVVALILIGVGSLYGFRFMSGALDAVTMVAIMLAFGFAFSWVFASIGLSLQDPETAQLAGFLLVFPFTFASAAFLPTATMPHWLQSFANNQPITFVANTARHFALGVPYPDGTLFKLGLWIAGILIVFVPLSVWLYRRRT